MTPEDILTGPLLERIRGRAAGYDRDNAFFHEDLAELTAAGYLKIFVPAVDGGLGLGLAEAAQLQRRLATAAPATALAVNMHLVWTGVAQVLAARGDSSLDFILQEAAQGEVFAFGNSEAGNDSVLFDSRTEAVPLPDGGYSFTGRKIFTSLSPAWTRLGIFGKDSSPRTAPGSWSTDSSPGKRPATRSCRTGTPSACGPASPTRPSWTAPSCPQNGSSGNCRWARTLTP